MSNEIVVDKMHDLLLKSARLNTTDPLVLRYDHR